MLFKIVAFWILVQLSAPTWTFVFVGISLAADIIRFGHEMYKKGMYGE